MTQATSHSTQTACFEPRRLGHVNLWVDELQRGEEARIHRDLSLDLHALGRLRRRRVSLLLAVAPLAIAGEREIGAV